MRTDEYAAHDAVGLAELIRRREVTPKEVAEAALAAIAALDPTLNALAFTLPDRAEAADAEAADGPLRGVPFLMKDLGITEAGTEHRMGSRLGAGLAAPRDSDLMGRFRRAGLVTLGVTTTPEFGFNVATESVLTGATRNPWDTARSPGGSSGGSAAAVAAGMVPLAHATDAGGSIRIPASCCGLFGLKPTRGRVSHGPDAGDALSGLSVQLGLARSVRDVAALLDAAAGPGVGDPFTVPPPERPYREEMSAPAGRLRIACTAAPWSGGDVDPDAVAGLEATAALCRDLGHRVVEDGPAVDAEAFSLALTRVWSANLLTRADLLGTWTGRTPSPENLEATVWRSYEYGAAMSAGDLLHALGVFNAVCRGVGAFFADVDVLLTPTVAGAARPVGTFDADDERYDVRGWVDHIFGFAPFTSLFNVTGQPAISVPLHETTDGLPVGMQFVGRYGDEATLLRLAAQLEEARPWADRRPPIGAHLP